MDSSSGENFDLSDYLEMSDWVEEQPRLAISRYPSNLAYVANEVSYGSGSNSIHHLEPARREIQYTQENREIIERVIFKTKTEIEVLDDGFKWRKYGKKKVKNSPNPRNYYKCSVEGCPVKKRVERDREDKGIVITTYESVHNHESSSRF